MIEDNEFATIHTALAPRSAFYVSPQPSRFPHSNHSRLPHPNNIPIIASIFTAAVDFSQNLYCQSSATHAIIYHLLNLNGSEPEPLSFHAIAIVLFPENQHIIHGYSWLLISIIVPPSTDRRRDCIPFNHIKNKHYACQGRKPCAIMARRRPTRRHPSSHSSRSLHISCAHHRWRESRR